MKSMTHRIEDFENDPAWTLSIGEKIGMIHYDANLEEKIQNILDGNN